MSNEYLNELEDVIGKALRAQGAEGLLTEWIVVAALRGFDDEGKSYTEIGTIIPSDMPAHHAIGLMALANQGD